MTFDITHDIFMAITKFAMTENSNRPVYDELEYLSYLMRQGDATASWLLPRILRAIAFAERHGIPDSFFKTLVENDNDGIPFTLVEPVKALKYHPPLIELRVNKPNRRGAYRAIFFPFEYKGEQFLIYTRSVIKQDTSSAEFDLAVQETEALIPDFLSNPSKYIHLEEVTADG